MTNPQDSQRTAGGRRWRWLLSLAFAMALLGLAFWAGRVTLQPQVSPLDATSEVVTAVVQQQTVGRSLNLNVTVTQKRAPLAVNVLEGVVTSVATSGVKKQGSVLYRVAAMPVRAVAGSMPFYRTLSAGAIGDDVAQLRRALVAKGLLRYRGRTFDAQTVRAMRAWQKALGIEQTGAVLLGEVVAVPTLPSLVSLDRAVLRRGALLVGGEEVVFGRVGKPSFALVVSEQQARLVPTSAEISITHPGKVWRAVIKSSEATATGETRFLLASRSGGSVCGKDCDLFAGDEDVFLPSTVNVIPPVTGPAIPVAAVRTAADKSAKVVIVADDGGQSDRPVTVLGSQDGVAVIEGVDVGERVLVLAGAQPTATSTAR